MKGCAVLIAVVLVTGFSFPGASDSATASKLITVELKDTTVRDALVAILDQAGVNYVLKQGIEGRIERLSLKDVGFQTALDSILKTSDLTYELDSGIYTIGPKKTETRFASAAPTEASAERPAPQLQPTAEEQAAVEQLAPVPEQPYYDEYGNLLGFLPPDYQAYPYYYDPYDYGTIIRNPWTGQVYRAPVYPYPYPRLRSVLPPAPWRPAPRVNGVPIY